MLENGLIWDLFDLMVPHFFSPGTSCRETSSNKRKYENDGACKLGPLDCLVYQEYVISFYHNYFVNSIDEGKFVASDCRVAW